MSSYSMNDMREMVSEVYPGRKWREKVDRMSDGQVMAIFHSFEKQGRFTGDCERDWPAKTGWEAPKRRRRADRNKRTVRPEEAPDPYADQLTFDDIL